MCILLQQDAYARPPKVLGDSRFLQADFSSRQTKILQATEKRTIIRIKGTTITLYKSVNVIRRDLWQFFTTFHQYQKTLRELK